MVAHSSPITRLWALGRGLLAGSALALAAAPAIPLDGGRALAPRLTFTDSLGQTHTRLTQTYQGLRVWGWELVSHGQTLDPGIALANPQGLDLTPSVTLAAAQQAILPALGATAASFSSSELVIYPRLLDLPSGAGGRPLNAAQVHQVVSGYALAYLIRAEVSGTRALNAAWDCLVDAHTGALLKRLPVNEGLAADSGASLVAVQVLPSTAPQAGDVRAAVGLGRSQYSGTVNLSTSIGGSGFLLLDTTRGQGGVFGGNAVTDMAHTMFGPPATGTLYTNSTNTWGDGSRPVALGPTTTPAGQTIAVDAAYGLQATWDYFKQVHKRDGIDGEGTPTYVRVNFGGYLNDTDNAFWSKATYAMTVQDGNEYWPLNNLTVMAHEFSHGVTASSTGLVYKGESGGLDEASADIFGVMADTYARGGSGGTIPATGANWLIPRYRADGVGTQVGALAPLRYLYKPSKDGVSPDAWSPSLGAIDVHYSSGPMNRAFYFLSQGASTQPADDAYSSYLPGGMEGIGNDSAARIWYRALTVYLTDTSNYLQARTAALRAAADLFPADASGNASRETLAVRKAFGAINVGDPNATVDDFVPPAISVSVAPSGTTTPSGANLALGATTSATYGVTEVDYFVDQVLVAAAFNWPNFTVPQLDPTRILANGSHTLTASAYDNFGSQGTSLGVPFTVANPVQQLLRDPGLEGGGLGWEGDTDLVVQTDYRGGVAHGGYRYASFSQATGGQNLILSQQVNLPAGTSALLSLWTQVQGNPALGDRDNLRILLQPPGQAAVQLERLDNRQNRADWLQRSYDLSAYQGQTVTLTLESDINPGTGTAFLVDDFALTSSAAAAQVQVQVSLDPAAFSGAPVAADRFPGGATVGPLYARVAGSPGSTAVTWSLLEGPGNGLLSSDSTPTYAPPARPGFYHVVATSVADPHVSAQISVQSLAGVSLIPVSATLEAGATLPLTVLTTPGGTATVSVSAGSIVQAATQGQWLFTAPAAPGTCTLTALSGAGETATAIITVIAPVQVTVSPNTLTMAGGDSYPLAAKVTGTGNSGVFWSVQEGTAGGSIAQGAADSPAVYTAPLAAGTYHLVATSAADPARSAVLTVTVLVNQIAINPAKPVALTGATVALEAFAPGGQAVTWSLPAGPAAGTIDSYGVYTAPAVPGAYAVQASAGSLSASVTVQVLTTQFSGSGSSVMNAADLAMLADAWGSSPGQAAWNPACDLNQDGVVNDQDVALFFTRFGGLP